MVELPPTIPVFRTADAKEAYSCTLKASKYYNVSPYLIQTVLQTEGGVKGSRTPNTNGTFDYGPMQINDIWVSELRRMENVNIDKNRLADDVCYNIYIGTWILSYKIADAGGDNWKGLGNYHSKTKKYHDKYMKRAVSAYSGILRHWIRVLGASPNSQIAAKKIQSSLASR